MAARNCIEGTPQNLFKTGIKAAENGHLEPMRRSLGSTNGSKDTEYASANDGAGGVQSDQVSCSLLRCRVSGPFGSAHLAHDQRPAPWPRLASHLQSPVLSQETHRLC
jgi:hypothetical protein